MKWKIAKILGLWIERRQVGCAYQWQNEVRIGAVILPAGVYEIPVLSDRCYAYMWKIRVPLKLALWFAS